MTRLDEIRAVARALNERAAEAAVKLTGGRSWAKISVAEIAAPHRPEGPGDSLHLCIRGARRGQWFWHARGEGGDMLKLVIALGVARDLAGAVAWARDFLGGGAAVVAAAPALRPAVSERDERARKAKASAAAFGLWNSGAPKIAGTLADLYLRGRGLDLRRLGRQPAALRFHPAVREPETGELLPALLALASGGDGRCQTVHRIWLEPDAALGAVKLRRVTSPKKFFSSPVGGIVRIWRGDRVDGETGEIKEGLPWQALYRDRALAAASAIVLTEGIENAIAVAIADPSLRVGAALAINLFRSVILPEGIGRVTLMADDDDDDGPAGGAGPGGALRETLIAGAGALMARYGCEVFIARPPRGAGDANDILRGESAA